MIAGKLLHQAVVEPDKIEYEPQSMGHSGEKPLKEFPEKLSEVLAHMKSMEEALLELANKARSLSESAEVKQRFASNS